jgi:peptide subunit release factor 1 (eRF1)
MNREDVSLLFTRSHNAVPSVLSVYLNVDQSQPENLNRGFATRLKQIASSAVRKVAVPERTRFEAAMHHVQDFVSAYAPAARGLVLFFDAVDGFFWHQELDCPIVNHVRWDRELFLQPLINAIDELEDYGVVLVDRVKSRLLVASLGKIEELPGRTAENKRVRHVKATGSDHAESSKRMQRKADNQIRENLRNVAGDIQAFVKTRKLRRLVLAGTPETTAELRSLLPARVALCLMGTVDISMNARAATVLEQTRPIAEAFEREEEAEKVSNVITWAAKNGKAVVGLGRTLKEVNSDRVWELVYASGETSPGYECPKCAALFSTRANRCTYCNSRVQPVGNVIERAVEHAIRKHAKVEVVTGEASAALQTAGGIGAFLKTRTGSVAV